MVDVSVIIPCFNHGLYIQEAIDSVLQCKDLEIEIIIIDDGSTDSLTLEKLAQLKLDGYQVLRQINSGPAFSRNTGIASARGRYILPLDADNKIKKEYLIKGTNILDSTNTDIVYSNPIFFGEPVDKQRFITKAFDGNDLFIHNYIDSCALYRKAVWEELGGYDIKIPFYGNEDWEFWLHAFIKRFRFTYLDESLFYYRILNNSLISTSGKDNHYINREYILKKHFAAFNATMSSQYSFSKMYHRDVNNPLRASAKYLFRHFQKILRRKK